MKVLITGSRDWPFTRRDVIRQAILDSAATILVHGDARGADTQAANIAKELGLDVRPYPAAWSLYGKAAGGIRNQEMLDKEHLSADPITLVLAFPLPESRGTWDMVRRAENAGITVKVFS